MLSYPSLLKYNTDTLFEYQNYSGSAAGISEREVASTLTNSCSSSLCRRLVGFTSISIRNKITEQTKKMMKTRENLQKLVSETKLLEAWAEYKCIRNKVNRLQHKESVWQKSEIGGNKTSKSPVFCLANEISIKRSKNQPANSLGIYKLIGKRINMVKLVEQKGTKIRRLLLKL